ncbi:hypothetical protein CRE_13767 [Caenorhabditis remanei]|uniref:Uncharacterized protein n=1 Tax=Caenorhabditis remanei TaxID=31234 RepID=E3NJM6_CAERE|nr:hypothetical protein CRE_13767 [Caenorhabditis remanei]
MIQSAPKKVMNEDNTGYFVTQENFNQNGMISSTIGNESMVFTQPPPTKQSKKVESFIFNFNKGSSPTIYIQKVKE